MKITGRLVGITKDFSTAKDKITLVVNEKLNPLEMQDYSDKTLDIKLEVARKKRGLNANGYAWALLGEMQEKLKIPKEEIYREYIRRCGPFEVIPIKDEAVGRFVESWGSNGVGWVCDLAKSKAKGYTNVLTYYGSSAYNSEEMALLLSTIVEDCIAYGIPTKKEEEIESLLKEWR